MFTYLTAKCEKDKQLVHIYFLKYMVHNNLDQN